MNKKSIVDLGIDSASVSVVLHATEDYEKVKFNIIKVFNLTSNRFEESFTRGHWGNEICLLNLRVDHKEAGQLIRKINDMLNKNDKVNLLNLLDHFVDEKNNLHLRIDKQRLCEGKIALSDQDSIKIKFKPIKTFKPRGKFSTYRDLLLSEQ
ncbi:MAG TPA: RNA-binding domain-containing protein [Nitrososphaeraceae archaeon]|jgi:RNA binding exosome subunit